MRILWLLGALLATHANAFQLSGHPGLVFRHFPAFARARCRAAAALGAAASGGGEDSGLPVEIRAVNEAEGKAMLEWPALTKNKVDHNASNDFKTQTSRASASFWPRAR